MGADKRTALASVALTAATHKPEALEFASVLAGELRARGCTVCVEAELGGCLADGCPALPLAQCAGADMIVVLGGDGTFLRAARVAAPAGTPLLGVDLGSFGFLAAEETDYLLAHLDQLVAGEYETERRMLLAARVSGPDGWESEWLLAFNDIAVMRPMPQRLVRVRATMDQELVAVFAADGLIVATASGSTAYNLSAGGPIVHPSLEALVLTPICPHTLHSRPLVMPAEVTLSLSLERDGKRPDEVIVNADGQDSVTLSMGQELVIQRAPYAATLARLRPMRFYDRLRTKLRWGSER